jgi:hypothetical protein
VVGCLGMGGTGSVLEGNMSEGSSEDRRLPQLFDFLLVPVGRSCGGTGSPPDPLLLLLLVLRAWRGALELSSCRTASREPVLELEFDVVLDAVVPGSRRLERSIVEDLCHVFLRGSCWAAAEFEELEAEVFDVEVLVEDEEEDSGSVLDRNTEREEGKIDARKDLLDVILGIMTVQQQPALHAGERF